MRRPRWKSRLLAAVFCLSVGMNGAVSACPNCKEAVSLQPGDASRMASGYNWSVLFMLVVPFSMMGTGAFLVHRAAKRGSLPEL